MALLPERSDVRQLLGRLRDAAEWGWKGGADNDTEQVSWRDGVQREPTEQEYLDEQLLLDDELADGESTRDDQKSNSASAIGKTFGNLNGPERDSMLEEIMTRMGAFNERGIIQELEDWKTRTD